jgi:hypothetical protein
MGAVKRNKCCNCGDLFVPDARNKGRQKYCFKPACRKASKAASHRQWLNKPENQDYFRCADNVKRVQQWRKGHPGYWRREKRNGTVVLQDSLSVQSIENNINNHQNASYALQDVLIMQPAVLIGLISNFTGIALQDDMVQTLLRLRQLGRDILNRSPTKGGEYDCQNPDSTKAAAQSAQKLQLDRPPSGP